MTTPTASRPSSADIEAALAFPRGKYKVEQLNALRPRGLAWKEYTARRSQIDFFGSHIEAGERYFRSNFGDTRAEYINLTPLSMDRLLFLVFGLNEPMRVHAASVRDMRAAEEREAMARVSAMFGEQPPTQGNANG